MTTYQLTGEGYVIKDGDTNVPTTDTPEWPNTNPDYVAYKAWLEAGGVPIPAEQPPIEQRRAAVWERIKAERDRRAALGVKVGAHWFHSDQKSRTQQLGLVLLGQSIPPGLKWKTLTFTPPPVFVEMTPALAAAIVQATAASDTAVFGAAEAHREALEASAAPQDYDFSAGWPASIEEEAHAAGIHFDAAAAL